MLLKSNDYCPMGFSCSDMMLEETAVASTCLNLEKCQILLKEQIEEKERIERIIAKIEEINRNINSLGVALKRI